LNYRISIAETSPAPTEKNLYLISCFIEISGSFFLAKKVYCGKLYPECVRIFYCASSIVKQLQKINGRIITSAMRFPDFSNPPEFLVATLLFFLIILARFLLLAGIFYAFFYKWFNRQWQHRKINHRSYKKNQFRKEVAWSMATTLIFSLAGSFTMLLWQQGQTKIYTDVSGYPLWYLPLSLLISMFIHETYYYWIHRWMHHPSVFKIVHKVHHESNITSPFTAFSFHPLEAVLQALILPATLMMIPMHPFVILVQLVLMTVSSLINHLDVEIYPQGFNKNIIGRWLIGATHHSLHHKQFRYNYGLYFTFWDKIVKTESPAFNTLFEEKSGIKKTK